MSTYSLEYSKTTPNAVNLTIDQELLLSFWWLHVVEAAGGGTFICNILAIWEKKQINNNK